MKKQKNNQKKTIVLIGFGEVGKAVYTVFSKYFNIIVIKDEKSTFQMLSSDIMLVAIPYSKSFVRIVKKYKKDLKAKTVIIFSTVQIGTCSKIGAVHSPIEGKHPHLAKSIKKMIRWVGGRDEQAIQFFKIAKMNLRIAEKPEITEALKLTSTTLYGVNIEFARYRKKIADKLGFSFDYFIEFDQDYNNLYKALGTPQFSRYLLTAPIGKIGGHCVVPNAEILKQKFPSIFIEEIIK